MAGQCRAPDVSFLTFIYKDRHMIMFINAFQYLKQIHYDQTVHCQLSNSCMSNTVEQCWRPVLAVTPHVYTHARLRVHAHVRTHTHTQTRTHTPAHTHTQTRAHTHARAHTHKHTHAPAYARTHAHAHTDTITRTHTHALTHPPTHTHTRTHSRARAHACTQNTHTHARRHARRHAGRYARRHARRHAGRYARTHAHTHTRTHTLSQVNVPPSHVIRGRSGILDHPSKIKLYNPSASWHHLSDNPSPKNTSEKMANKEHASKR